MKSIAFFPALVGALCGQAAWGQQTPAVEMTTYYMAFLYRGPNTAMPQAEAAKIQAAHMAHIGKMADSGKLILAGPFMDNGELRGIFVFKVGSMDEAQALTDSDPAVKAGRLKVEIRPWYSAKGIQVVKDAAPKEK